MQVLQNDTVGSINSYISYIIFCFHKDDVVIGLNCFSIFQFADIFYRPCIVFVWFSGIRKVLVCQCFCIIIFCQQIFIVFICSSVSYKVSHSVDTGSVIAECYGCFDGMVFINTKSNRLFQIGNYATLITKCNLLTVRSCFII